MTMWEHWVEESFYVAWSQGVDALAWYLLRDKPCSPNCAVTYQSGMYYLSGHAKPGSVAFRFPFVAEPAGGGHAVVWGIAPEGGTVAVEVRGGSSWRAVATFSRGAHAIFSRTIAAHAGQLFRARIGRDTSLSWRYTASHCQPATECNVFIP
jgi:hypothetical protein